MTNILYATFDGEALRPEEPISLEPGTRVRLIIERPDEDSRKGEPYSFFHAALACRIDGPPDWSERLHQYLYGEDCRSGE